MKKNLIKILLIISLFIIPNTVFAAGGLSVSTTYIGITQGSSSSFTVKANNAAGGVSISSSNPGVASVSMGSTFLDNSSATITVTGHAVGNAVITVKAFDMATYDEEVVTTTYNINVNVKAKPVYTPPPVDTRSTNTNLSKVTINGVEVAKKDNNYYLSVSNYVTSVDISSVVQDSKSKVVNPGKKDLVVGDNYFNIVVTAERGNTATHKVIVNRSQFNTINDLDALVKLGQNYDINMGDGLELTEEQLTKIINSKKTFGFNKYDKDNKLIYSWVLSGEVLGTVGKFNLNVIDKLEDDDKFEKAFNYADGIFLDFSDCIEIPNGAMFKYFVGDKYTKDDVIYLYTYNDENGEITKISENVSVKSGFLELEISDTIKHFASQTVVMNAKDKTEVNTWMYAAIGEVVFIVLLVILFMIIYSRKGKPKKVKEPKVVEEVVPVVTHVKDVYTGPVDNSMVKNEVSTEPVEDTKIVANTGNPLVDKGTQDIPVITQSTPVAGEKKKMNTNSASSIVENLKPTPNNFQTMPEVKEK